MKRFLSATLVLMILLSLSATVLAKDNDKLPGEGKDGLANGQGHDWADLVDGMANSNDNKLIDKFLLKGEDHPGYQNHMPADPDDSEQ